jgi:hypothetical protein
MGSAAGEASTLPELRRVRNGLGSGEDKERRHLGEDLKGVPAEVPAGKYLYMDRRVDCSELAGPAGCTVRAPW